MGSPVCGRIFDYILTLCDSCYTRLIVGQARRFPHIHLPTTSAIRRVRYSLNNSISTAYLKAKAPDALSQLLRCDILASAKHRKKKYSRWHWTCQGWGSVEETSGILLIDKIKTQNYHSTQQNA